jgi:hypothetical protein
VSNQRAGEYVVSIWVDPDATDDGSAGGQFWVTLQMEDGTPVPTDTRVSVTIAPLDRQGPSLTADAVPVHRQASHRFAGLPMDHEGRFSVRAAIAGAKGTATIDSAVDATYDLRPPPLLLAVYLMPFLFIGFLWFKVLRERRRRRPSALPK